MTHFRELTTAAAALTLGTLMSTTAFAADDDMTCGDFNALDSDAQMEVAMNQGPMAGREEMQEKARGEDGMNEGAEMESSSNEDLDAVEGAGREGQQEMGRGGDEMVAAMIEHCKGGDDLMVSDAPLPEEAGNDR